MLNKIRREEEIKRYNNKHQIIQIMLYNKIILYSFILSLILFNAKEQHLTIKKKKKHKKM